jgi:hypothetical protein
MSNTYGTPDITVTNDLSRFGFRELKMAAQLLTAFTNYPYSTQLGDGITIYMNSNSGNVFLSDEDFNVAMMNGDKLEDFYTCPECGREGFAEEMNHNEGRQGCQEYLESIGIKELIANE